MPHSSLTPVFLGLRAGLHVLTAALLVLVAVRVLITGDSTAALALVLVLAFAALYAGGRALSLAPPARRQALGRLWLGGLCAVWTGLMLLVPEAAYLVFPLFFLLLHLLPRPWGEIGVLAATALAILALGLHHGFSLGGVVGPLVGAGVALLIGLGYQALAREAREREELLAELLATRSVLAAAEREQGVLTERSRLAREIHDTVAQDLSSIQMLLHAAEQSIPDGAGMEHVRLARETAAHGLADARRFIRELAPEDLERGLGPALDRLARGIAQRTGLEVEVEAPADLDLPVAAQVALLRISQGALANVAQHARADRARVQIALEDGGVQLSIADDGAGFDSSGLAEGTTGVLAAAGAASRPDSFGLRAIAQRAADLGGTLQIDSAPGRGTRLVVRAPLPDSEVPRP